MLKLALIIILSFVVSAPTYAKAVQKDQLKFPIEINKLLKGEIHYFSTILSPRKLAVQYPEIFELDSLSLIQESNIEMFVNKTVSIVKKPIGFFEQDQLMDENYVAHIMGEQKVKKLSKDSYMITIPGKHGYSYRIQSFFDSDDVSTLPNSRVIRAVSAAKKLDIISQGASTIMFSEKSSFTRFTEGGVTVSSFIPLKENKTLIITYNVWAIQKKFALKEVLTSSFIKEIEAVKALQEGFKN